MLSSTGRVRPLEEAFADLQSNTGLSTRAITAMTISDDGGTLYAATDGEGVFRLDLPVAPKVRSHPSSTSAAVGATASFTAAASGTPTPTVQWQASTNGGST